ncbi:DsbA family protein, partial [Streptomyces toxytricini]|uniref:DsbA family protein n=1 Tax=Streptomyces toxytricini TaxID=67369 RepID=UPI003412AFC2
ANTGKDGAGGGPVTAPSGATGEDSLAIRTGSAEAPSTLVVWEDFRCPACKNFETMYKDTVHELEAKGLLKTDYHLVTLIDGNMGGSGSLKSANAAACAQDAGKFTEYHDVLFENQPPEPDDAYGKNAKLLELAGKVPGLDTAEFRACVEGGTHESWVGKSFEAFREGKFRGTPTVLLNGKDVMTEQITPQKMKEIVEAAAKGGAAKSASPASPAASGSPSAAGAPASKAKGSASASRTASPSASARGTGAQGAARE